MSRKIDVFRAALGNPLTRHNFIITIPHLENTALSNVQILVQSTSLPSERLRDIILYYLGERIKYPTIPENSGEWSCNIPDNELGLAFETVMKEKGLYWKQKAGILLPGERENVKVTMRTVNDSPVFEVIMHNAYCKGRGDESLNNNDPTAVLSYNITWAYDWIEDVHKVNSEANETD